MNGPEHYKRAEEMLQAVEDFRLTGTQQGTDTVAAAQVHATLALAAAQIDVITDNGTDFWAEVLS